MNTKDSKAGVESLLRLGLILMIVPVLFLIFLRYSGVRERQMSRHVVEHAADIDISLMSFEHEVERQAGIIGKTLPILSDDSAEVGFIEVLLSDFVAENDDAYAYFYKLGAEASQVGWFAAKEGFAVSSGVLDRPAMAYGTVIDIGQATPLYIGAVYRLALNSHDSTKIMHIQSDDGEIFDCSHETDNLIMEQSVDKLDTNSEYTVVELDGDNYLLSYHRLVNGFMLVEIQWLTFVFQRSFYAIGLITAAILLLFILSFPFLEGGASPLKRLVKYSFLDEVQNRLQLLRISGRGPDSYIKVNEIYAAAAVWVMMLAPFAVQVVAMRAIPNAYAVMLVAPIGLVVSLFLPRAYMTQRFLLGYFIAAQLVIFLEYIFVGTLPVLITGGVVLLGYSLYCVVGSYVRASVYRYERLETTSQQFNQSQALYLENEKMATLGRLISGIAHEINTPMGAIKACAENMDIKLKPVVRGLLHIGQTGGILEEDIEDLFTLIDLCSKSVREMRSTSEVRKAKKQLKEYAKIIGLDDNIVSILIKLELCDIEKLESNIDVFKNPRIELIMKTLEHVYTYVSNLQNVAYASDRITRIVFALKSYAHTGDKDQFIPFDIVRNMDNVLVLYHNQTKHGIEVVKDFGENLPYAVGNQDELSQVWTNLIQNAIYAMSGVGKLKISIHMADNDSKIEVKIADTGSGIAEENLEKIFDSFFTTKPNGEGSGLGLDICRKIVRQHSGEITVNSALGVGTTFTVSLPSDGTMR